MFGEQGQTILIERQVSMHRTLQHQQRHADDDIEKNGKCRLSASSGSMTSLSSRSQSESLPLLRENAAYGSPDQRHTIRHQVVVWYIGKLDVITGCVPMTFRVTLFWNDPSSEPPSGNESNDDDDISTSTSLASHTVWKMHGRRQAFQHELKDMPMKSIDVPPISIMNVSTFEIVSPAEVAMLNDDTRLMRWTCMYRATVLQENLSVERFPHDIHEIQIRLAILSERERGRRWDRRFWKLGLATSADNLNSIRVPYGLVVDTVNMPGFHFNKERNMEFQFRPLRHGSFQHQQSPETSDMYLQASLTVLRESGYYDNNIVPLLALLNVVAVSVTTMDDRDFFKRGLLTMNIAFVEIGIRMTADSHLPSVGYEIQLQRILNEFFYMLMFLVLEAMTVSVLRNYFDSSSHLTGFIDWGTGIIALAHNFYTVSNYYSSKRMAAEEIKFGRPANGQVKWL